MPNLCYIFETDAVDKPSLTAEARAPSVGTLELEKGTGGPVIMNASNDDYLVLREKVPRICEGELYWMSCDNERQ